MFYILEFFLQLLRAIDILEVVLYKLNLLL